MSRFRQKSVCDGCAFAKWYTGAKGRRTGAGECTFVYEQAPLPRARWLIQPIQTGGGYISLTIENDDAARNPNVCKCKKEIES